MVAYSEIAHTTVVANWSSLHHFSLLVINCIALKFQIRSYIQFVGDYRVGKYLDCIVRLNIGDRCTKVGSCCRYGESIIIVKTIRIGYRYINNLDAFEEGEKTNLNLSESFLLIVEELFVNEG